MRKTTVESGASTAGIKNYEKDKQQFNTLQNA